MDDPKSKMTPKAFQDVVAGQNEGTDGTTTDGNSDELLQLLAQRQTLFRVVTIASSALFAFGGVLLVTVLACPETRGFVKEVPVALIPISLIMIIAASLLITLMHSLYRGNNKKDEGKEKDDRKGDGVKAWPPIDYVASAVSKAISSGFSNATQDLFGHTILRK